MVRMSEQMTDLSKWITFMFKNNGYDITASFEESNNKWWTRGDGYRYREPARIVLQPKNKSDMIDINFIERFLNFFPGIKRLEFNLVDEFPSSPTLRAFSYRGYILGLTRYNQILCWSRSTINSCKVYSKVEI
jgi:hypothetical protein